MNYYSVYVQAVLQATELRKVAINAVLPLEVGSRPSRQLFSVLNTRPALRTEDALKIDDEVLFSMSFSYRTEESSRL